MSAACGWVAGVVEVSFAPCDGAEHWMHRVGLRDRRIAAVIECLGFWGGHGREVRLGRALVDQDPRSP